jgi:hypothetical protein
LLVRACEAEDGCDASSFDTALEFDTTFELQMDLEDSTGGVIDASDITL